MARQRLYSVWYMDTFGQDTRKTVTTLGKQNELINELIADETCIMINTTALDLNMDMTDGEQLAAAIDGNKLLVVKTWNLARWVRPNGESEWRTERE